MFSFDRRTLYFILGAMLLMNVLLGGRSIESIIYALPGVIVAMTFHEFAHAWVATKLGDDTPRLQGRLNLNPMSHIDPIGLVCLALLGFGWGKPVQINPRNFDGKYSLSKAEAMVAAERRPSRPRRRPLLLRSSRMKAPPSPPGSTPRPAA